MALTENEMHDLIKDCKFYNNSIKLQSYNNNFRNLPESVFNDKIKRCRMLLESKYLENPIYRPDYTNGIYDYRTNRSIKREHFNNSYHWLLIMILLAICVTIVYT